MIREESIDLRPDQLTEVKRLLGLHLPGIVVWAYGSRVKGTARRTSDLDLVAFTSDIAKLSDARDAFEESDLSFIVDLHSWDRIPTEFHAEIERCYVPVA